MSARRPPAAEPATRALWEHELTHSALPRRARLTGLALATRATTAGHASVTVPDVAELAGVHPSTARRGVEDLHAAGYLIPRPQPPYTGRSAALTPYRLTVPVPWGGDRCGS